MKEKIAKLIDRKSIITLIMVAALVAGWFKGMVTAEQFIPLVTMIITVYFAKINNYDKVKEENTYE